MCSQYKDFKLYVHKDYTIHVSAPGVTDFVGRFDKRRKKEIKRLVKPIEKTVRCEPEEIKEVGKRLFDALFTGSILHQYERLRQSPELKLRIRLTVEPPDLDRWPWELAMDYDPSTGPRDFLTLHQRSTIVRTVPGAKCFPSRPAKTPVPLRVLYMHASPLGARPIPNDCEVLRDVFSKAGCGEVEHQHAAKMSEFREKLRGQNARFDVLHFAGHGVFVDEGHLGSADAGVWRMLRTAIRAHRSRGRQQQDGPPAGAGYAVWHNAQDEKDFVSARELARAVEDFGVRLVVLVACELAKGSERKPFSGFARELIRNERELAAVVAMNFDFHKNCATPFTREFYKTLIEGWPVEEALRLARQAIIDEESQEVNLMTPYWAAPVLFLQCEDGHIFGEVSGGEVTVRNVTGKVEEPKGPDEAGGRTCFETRIDCSGEVSGFETGKMHLWLVTETDDKWGHKFPKRTATVTGEGETKKWSATIKEEGQVEQFDLALYAVTPEKDEEIRKWLREGEEYVASQGGKRRKKGFPAFPLPNDGELAKRLDWVPGVRRDLEASLEGVHGSIRKLTREDSQDRIMCSGRAAGVETGVHLWLVVEVRDEQSRLLFPKRDQVKVEPNGTWHHSISQEGTDGPFDLALYAVGSKVHFWITDWIEQGARCDNYPGMKPDKIPDDGLIAKRLDSVLG